jgi:hypothetical protein
MAEHTAARELLELAAGPVLVAMPDRELGQRRRAAADTRAVERRRHG